MIVRSLKECIIESLLDDEDEVFDGAKEGIVKAFLEENYEIYGSYTVKEIKNKFIVDVKGDIEVENKNIVTLTNGFFEFGVINGIFECRLCESLTSLEGAPQKVIRDFCCIGCKSLKSLEGAPKEVGGDFDCYSCNSLKTLEGAPQKVGKDFNCSHCYKLKSLKGAPKKVGECFCCRMCGVEFTEEDVKKYTTVAGTILV